MKRIDLHRHLEGCLRVETICELGRQFSVALPAMDPEGLRPHVSVAGTCRGLLEFLEKFQPGASVLADLAACRRVARECIEDAAAEHLDYLELRFSPAYMGSAWKLDLSGVVASVVDGIAEASVETGLPVALIGTITRTYGPERAWAELQAFLEHKSSLCAIDLAGDEAGFPPSLFTAHFDRAREEGFPVCVHAGEAAGPDSIRVAIERLGAVRIGHGTRALEDPTLIDLMLARNTGIECCLTSNLQTGAIASLREHPLRTFLKLGLRATINTDDPAISRIDLAHEALVAAATAGLTREQIECAASHSESLAFSPL